MPILSLNKRPSSHTTIAPSWSFFDELENRAHISPLPLYDTALL
jgi:hypothetical protein